MIHPYTGDSISVRLKFSHVLSDNRGIGSIHAHSGKIRYEQIPHACRVHQKQCQAILPQISPAPAAFSVIMMWQKRASVDSPQFRLKIHPVHKLIKKRICGVIMYFIFFFPILSGFL